MEGRDRAKVYAGCGHWLVRMLSGLALVTVVVVLVTGYRAYTALQREPSNDYGLLVDAGSHGSRIQLFSWKQRLHDPKRPLRGPISIPEHIWQENAAPGISSKLYDPTSTAEDCIKPLIASAEAELRRRKISEDVWPTIPIYLKATAGLRDVGVTSRSAIMWNIRDWLSNKANSPFLFKPEWCRVTAGEEEGVYGWLSVNTVMNTWNASAADTIGSLDLGGASAQITFFPIHTSVLEDYYAVTMGSRLLRLYSHSYLGFGWGDALMRLTTRLGVEVVLDHMSDNKKPTNTSDLEAAPKSVKQMNTGAAPVAEGAETVVVDATHPCFPKGHQFTIQMPSLVYPDGRFYVDINFDHIVEYMKAVGLPKTELKKIENQAFIEHNSGESTKRALTSLKATRSEEVADEELHGTLPFPGPQKLPNPSSFIHSDDELYFSDEEYARRSSGESITIRKSLTVFENFEASDDDDDVVSDIPGRPPALEGLETVVESPDTQDHDAITGEIPERLPAAGKPHHESGEHAAHHPDKDTEELPHSYLLAKKNSRKHKKNFADVVYQDSIDKASRFGAKSSGPFHALSHPGGLGDAKRWFTIRFHGDSNYEQCKLRADDLFFNAPCFIHSCSFEGVYQPRLDTSKFIAFGQYSKVISALGVSPKAPLSELEEATKKFCGLSKSEIRSAHRKGSYRPYGKSGVMNLCWKATWAYSFLIKGLQFPVNSTQIEFAGTIGKGENQQSPGWGLGSMIYEINLLPWESPIGQYQLPFAASLLAIGLLSLLTIVLCSHVEWMRKMVTDSDGYVNMG